MTTAAGGTRAPFDEITINIEREHYTFRPVISLFLNELILTVKEITKYLYLNFEFWEV